MTAVFGLERDHAIARRDVRFRERGIGERVVAGRGAERMAGHRIGAAEREAALHGQRIAADPPATGEPDVDAASRADAGVIPDVDKHAVEPIAVGNRIAHRRGYARVRHDVGASGILERRPDQPPRRRFFGIVAGVEHRAGGDRGEMPLVDRRVRAPFVGIAKHRPGILSGDARLPLTSQLDGQRDLPLRLREGARRPTLVQVVIAVIAPEEERAPADLRAVETPVFDRRDDVECAQRKTDGPHVSRAQLTAEHVAEIAPPVGQVAGGPEHAQRVDAHPEIPLELPVE